MYECSISRLLHFVYAILMERITGGKRYETSHGLTVLIFFFQKGGRLFPMMIQEYTNYVEEDILHLYNSVGWTAYTDHPATLREGFSHSLLTLAAYEDDQLVGLIRTVGDGVTVVLIQDLLVLPDYQHKGIGSRLLQAALDRFSHVRQIQLVTDQTEKNISFYQSRGFMVLSQFGCCGMMRS